MKVICNAADRCGDAECPHAKPHEDYGKLACGHYSCETFQEQKGIGKKRSECECVPIEEKNAND